MNQPLMQLANSGDSVFEDFQRDGFCKIASGIPEDVLDRATQQVSGVLAREPRVQDAWKTSPDVHRIATWPGVLQLLRRLYPGHEPKPFQTLNFRMGTEQDIHSDTVHFNSMPNGLMCGVWLALEDIDDENGPLVYYPGSQAWPEATLRDVEEAGYFRRGLWDDLLKLSVRLGVPPHAQGPHYKAYERFMADKVAASGVKPQLGTVKKGELIVWAANLLHGGSPQKDKTRTRMSQVSHYFFEGCRYYTPLHSHGDYVCFRKPQWLPPLGA